MLGTSWAHLRIAQHDWEWGSPQLSGARSPLAVCHLSDARGIKGVSDAGFLEMRWHMFASVNACSWSPACTSSRTVQGSGLGLGGVWARRSKLKRGDGSECSACSATQLGKERVSCLPWSTMDRTALQHTWPPRILDPWVCERSKKNRRSNDEMGTRRANRANQGAKSSSGCSRCINC